MKIIKSFLLVTVCLSATTLLHAQEVKTEVLKQTEVKAPPTDIANKPSPAPQLIPMNGIAPKEAPKVQALTADANGPANKLTADQLKTLNGIADKPKQTAPAAAPDAQQNVKPQIILAPAPVMIKQDK
ncbi:MAG: hypothetical protein ABI685_11615 [Ferruginibacter sp.]